MERFFPSSTRVYRSSKSFFLSSLFQVVGGSYPSFLLEGGTFFFFLFCFFVGKAAFFLFFFSAFSETGGVFSLRDKERDHLSLPPLLFFTQPFSSRLLKSPISLLFFSTVIDVSLSIFYPPFFPSGRCTSPCSSTSSFSFSKGAAACSSWLFSFSF